MDLPRLKNKVRRTGTHIARKISNQQKIIASLTSYPPRIATVDASIRSLLAQKTLPDLIVLYLCEEDFPNKEKDLPSSLTELLAHDVIIRWVDKDLKSHKKWFWAVQEYPDDLIVLFDDDLTYRNTLIGELLDAHQAFPNSVCSVRGHLIKFDENEGTVIPYSDWLLDATSALPQLANYPNRQLFITSGAGTLLPPHSIPSEAFDIETMLSDCLLADDVWLNVMFRRNSFDAVVTTTDQTLLYVPDTQDVALCHFNLEQGGNDHWFDLVGQRFYGSKDAMFDELFKDPRIDDLLKA